MPFGVFVPAAGVAVESDPTALKIAQDLADLNDAATARTNLQLGELAELDIEDIREVTAGGSDGQVLTAQGAGVYGWEDAPGGGGLSETSVTVSTGEIAASGSVNIDFGILSPRFLITEVRVERTAGTGTGMCLSVWADDARSAGRQWLMGSEFSSGVPVAGSPVYGTQVEISASFVQGLVYLYRNRDDTSIIRATADNKDGVNPATYDITIYGFVLG